MIPWVSISPYLVFILGRVFLEVNSMHGATKWRKLWLVHDRGEPGHNKAPPTGQDCEYM